MGRDLILIWFRYQVGAWKLQKNSKCDWTKSVFLTLRFRVVIVKLLNKK
jgi:hypothetical protein